MARWVLTAVVLSVFITQAILIPLEDFYPFGLENGDEELPGNDDGSTEEIQLTVSFPFFDEDHNTLFVNNNGDISFERSLGQYTPDSFPLTDSNADLQIIAPYWADVDTTTDSDYDYYESSTSGFGSGDYDYYESSGFGSVLEAGGSVWYRETADPELRERASKDIASGFVTHENFIPTYLFIATWDHVGYYSRNNDKTNTFQCVMATNGVTSFVIFLYADNGIQWTTGDASGGSNGFGGTPAQVGFNAGDGERFASVPGSQTNEIVNISTTSNVGVPGVWIFQVDQEEVEYGGCSREDSEVTISPRYGPFLGGQAVKVQGPCFEPSSTIECVFGDKEVGAVYISELVVLCISPMFNPLGNVKFSLLVDREEYDGPSFVTLSHFRGHSVDIVTDTLIFTERSEQLIRWEPQTVFPLLPPTDYKVDISLYKFSVNTEQWEEVLVFSAGTENDGEEEIVFREILGRDGNTAPIAVFVSLTPSDEDSIQAELRRYNLKPGIWSAEFYYAKSTVLESTGTRLCSTWYLSEPDDIGSEILSSVTPCPRTEQQASQLCNSGVRVESYISLYGNTLYNEQQMNFFHPDVAICHSQPITSETETDGKGQHCCYSNNGNLVTGPPGGGSVDLWSEDINFAKHYQEDIEPFIFCCKGELPNYEYYYERRPSDDGSKFDPLPCSWMLGDPHFVTLDGFRYTFNGHGEFILLRTINSSELMVQGRMVSSEVIGNGLGIATVFSAIVAKQSNTDAIQFQLSRRGLDVLVNGTRVQFSDLKEQIFGNVTLQDLEDSTVSALFSSGMSITVQESNGFLSVIRIVLPDSYKSSVEGLLGNYNGDTSDDLTPKSESLPLPVDSTDQDLHYNFGVTWIIDNQDDSLFTYTTGSWFDFYLPDFSPIFQTDLADAEAESVCGDDVFCRFDFLVTGRTDIGISTLVGSTNIELVANLTLPVVCSAPCEQGVCVANDTCSCSTGYAGFTCNEIVYSECDTNPCLNGGTCRNHAGTYTCMCSSEFSGSTCEDGGGDALRNIIITAAISAGAFFILMSSTLLLICICCAICKKKTKETGLDSIERDVHLLVEKKPSE